MAGGVRNEGDEKRANDIETLGNGRLREFQIVIG